MTIGVAILILLGAAIPIGFLAVMTYIAEGDRARAKAALKSIGIEL